MAQNTTVEIAGDTWTQLTDADVTAITFQNNGMADLYVTGTASAVAPTNTVGAIKYPPNMGERNALMADLFPGITAVRVYAFSSAGASVMVSHA